MKLRRYLIFRGAVYYPCGGWDDLAVTCDTLEAAKEAAKLNPQSWDWSQIVDTETGEEVRDET